MSHLDIIRAWKDEEYRLSLTTAERAQLPDKPAGLIELTDADLDVVAGGVEGSPDAKELFELEKQLKAGG